MYQIYIQYLTKIKNRIVLVLTQNAILIETFSFLIILESFTDDIIPAIGLKMQSQYTSGGLSAVTSLVHPTFQDSLQLFMIKHIINDMTKFHPRDRVAAKEVEERLVGVMEMCE